MSNDPKLDARRACGSHETTMEDALVAREAAMREVEKYTEQANRAYRAHCDARKADPNSIAMLVAPGRWPSVTPVLRVLLDEHPRFDFSPKPLTAEQQAVIDARKQKERAQEAEFAKKASKLAASGSVPFGGTVNGSL